MRTARGVRLVQDDAVLSEVLERPGPTHSVFDVLAACIAALDPGDRVVLLGFAGGGVVAPLRAMGSTAAIEAVDLDPRGARVFRRVCGRWAGAVRCATDDAVAWLGARRGALGLVVEDLSCPGPRGVTKPAASLDDLPRRIREALQPDGAVVVNLLPVPGWSWDRLVRRVAAGHRHVRVVEFRTWHNRVVVAGARVPPARQLGWALRAALGSIRSRIRDDLRVRTVR